MANDRAEQERKDRKEAEEQAKIEVGRKQWEAENQKWKDQVIKEYQEAKDRANEGYSGTLGPPDRDR